VPVVSVVESFEDGAFEVEQTTAHKAIQQGHDCMITEVCSCTWPEIEALGMNTEGRHSKVTVPCLLCPNNLSYHRGRKARHSQVTKLFERGNSTLRG
jgi:hypothetical protein